MATVFDINQCKLQRHNIPEKLQPVHFCIWFIDKHSMEDHKALNTYFFLRSFLFSRVPDCSNPTFSNRRSCTCFLFLFFFFFSSVCWCSESSALPSSSNPVSKSTSSSGFCSHNHCFFFLCYTQHAKWPTQIQTSLIIRKSRVLKLNLNGISYCITKTCIQI